MAQSSQYQNGDVIFRHATDADDNSLKVLLRDNEMDGWIKLSFEREPCFFKGAGLMGESYAVIVHNADLPDKVMGMYVCDFLPVHINGKKETVGYLAGLRVSKAYRNKIRFIKSGYDSIHRLIPEKTAEANWFTSIAIDNYAARHLLEAGLKGLPTYTPVQQISTLAISATHARKTGVLQKIDRQDISAFVSFYNQQMSSYQFSPVLTEKWILNLKNEKGLSLDDFYLIKDNKKIIACLVLWDQRAFKQTVVKAYRFPLNKMRRIINFLAATTRRIPLPDENEKLELIFLAFLAIDDNYKSRSIAIIQDVLCKAKEKNAKGIVVGLSEANPVLPIIKAKFHGHLYQTSIETVSWPDKKSSQPALQPILPFQPRVQPEVALM